MIPAYIPDVHQPATRTVPTRSGGDIVVDEEDYDRVNNVAQLHGWYLKTSVSGKRLVTPKGVSVGKVVLDILESQVKVFHLNGNIFDARKCNLSLKKKSRVHPKNLKRFAPDGYHVKFNRLEDLLLEVHRQVARTLSLRMRVMFEKLLSDRNLLRSACVRHGIDTTPFALHREFDEGMLSNPEVFTTGVEQTVADAVLYLVTHLKSNKGMFLDLLRKEADEVDQQ